VLCSKLDTSTAGIGIAISPQVGVFTARKLTFVRGMKAIDQWSPRRLARIAGGLYLVNILLGAFAIGVVPAIVIVAGDAAATARNIQANELLYRSGLFVLTTRAKLCR
jgi:uncharacterized protein DUF4386